MQKNTSLKGRIIFFSAIVFGVIVFVSGVIILPDALPIRYEMVTAVSGADFPLKNHVGVPDPLKAVYMTSWVAGSAKLRQPIIDLIGRTELNAIVIDIKDYSGRLAFEISDPIVSKWGANENRVPDIKDLIKELHQKGIYIIGRISVFQDPYLAGKRPELAVKRKSDNALPWRDRKGLSWLDPHSKEVWAYVAGIGKSAYEVGFDELNFDYIRFPSDGNMEDVFYTWDTGEEKKETIRKFFGFLKKEFRGTGAILSADLFGMTATNPDDLRIGQYLEYALPYFDYVSPMVYPSHYPENWNGLKNPAAKPYEVIKYSMDIAKERALPTPEKLRPWLQDFNLGAVYTAEMIRAEKQAVYDSGLTSWMLWSPSNKYTEGAIDKD